MRSGSTTRSATCGGGCSNSSRRWRTMPTAGVGWLPRRQSATGNATMAIVADPADGVSEVHAQGTITTGSTFTIELDLNGVERLPASPHRCAAEGPGRALKIPEDGFVVSQLTAELVDAAGSVVGAVPLKVAFCDEADPLFDPERACATAPTVGATTRGCRGGGLPCSFPNGPWRFRPAARLRLSMNFGQSRFRWRRPGYRAEPLLRFVQRRLDSVCEPVGVRPARSANWRGCSRSVPRSPAWRVPIMAEQPASLARHDAGVRPRQLARSRGGSDAGRSRGDAAAGGREPADRLAMARWLRRRTTTR